MKINEVNEVLYEFLTYRLFRNIRKLNYVRQNHIDYYELYTT
jgi:hypothetical protein